MTTSAQSPTTTAADMKRIRAWKERHLMAPDTLPFSYTLAHRPFRGIPPDFQPSVVRRRIDANIVEAVFEGTDETIGLTIRVECFEYHDYPVVEWTAWFTNSGTAETPLLSDIHAIDASFEGSTPILHHCNGDRAADPLYHDHYLLTPHSRSDTKRVVRQFDRPEGRDGLIQGVRHSACEEESIAAPMKVLHPDSEYRFENPETGDTMLLSGQVLGHSGFAFKLPKRSAAMWFYSLVG